MTPSLRASRLLVLSIVGAIALTVIGLGPIDSGPQTNLVAPISANQATDEATAGGPETAAPSQAAPGASALVQTPPDVTPEPTSDLTDRLALTQRPAPPDELAGYRWPLIHGRLTLPFGPTPWGSRIVDGQRFHDGIDLATFCNDRIVAAHDGVVIAAGRHFDDEIGWIGDLGPYFRRLDAKKLWETLPIVIITDDGNGYRSVYAHFWKIVVKPGETIRAGQLIGYEGRTGRASGCHLHYDLFSPLESASFGIDPAVVKRMKVPTAEVARIDPLLVLPYRKDLAEPRTSPSPVAPPE